MFTVSKMNVFSYLYRYRADRQLVVKEYLRPAAGKEGAIPADLRPGPVLVKTTTHLIKK